MFDGPLSYSIIKRAENKKIIQIEKINIRDFADDKYRTVDDHPYGGGVGMIMKVDVLDRAISQTKCPKKSKCRERIILMDPKGVRFTQKETIRLSKFKHLIIICGHYEGVDERITNFIDEKISVGDFILTGGEIGSMIIVDSITRVLPGVLTKGAVDTESVPPNYLEYPQYTRPDIYKKLKVPDTIISGNHGKIEKWRNDHAVSTIK